MWWLTYTAVILVKINEYWPTAFDSSQARQGLWHTTLVTCRSGPNLLSSFIFKFVHQGCGNIYDARLVELRECDIQCCVKNILLCCIAQLIRPGPSWGDPWPAQRRVLQLPRTIVEIASRKHAIVWEIIRTFLTCGLLTSLLVCRSAEQQRKQTLRE